MAEPGAEQPAPAPSRRRGPALERWGWGRRGWIIVGVGVPVLAFLAILAWASLSFGGGGSGRAVNSTALEEPVESAAARDFELELIGGGSVRLASLRGQVVMIDFWASWCPPCRQEAPVLAEVYEEYRDRGVEFIGVNIWDTPDQAETFLQEEGQVYPAGIDADGRIGISYGVRGIPEKYFVTREGAVSKKFVGPLTADLLRATLEGLLGEGK